MSKGQRYVLHGFRGGYRIGVHSPDRDVDPPVYVFAGYLPLGGKPEFFRSRDDATAYMLGDRRDGWEKALAARSVHEAATDSAETSSFAGGSS